MEPILAGRMPLYLKENNVSIPAFDLCTCLRALSGTGETGASNTTEELFDWWCSHTQSHWPWASFALHLFAADIAQDIAASRRK